MKRIDVRRMRIYSISAIIALSLSGVFTSHGWGTLSSFGYDDVSAICPLGYLETTLASRTFVPRLFVGFGATMLATIIFGRVFCAWVCPVPFVRRCFTTKDGKSLDNGIPLQNSASAQSRHTGHSLLQAKPAQDSDMTSALPATTESNAERLAPDTRYYVLGGALLSSAIFGFPVFCLICPVGLFFGTLFALMRLFRFNEPTITLIVFPVVLLVEVVLLQKWCSKICPLGALISLVSRLNRTLRPRIDTDVCLTTSRGLHCFACKRVCSEGIDLHEDHAGMAMCTKCGDCADVCPAKAIHFPWWRKGHVSSRRHARKLSRTVG